jgi:hypothetical protein
MFLTGLVDGGRCYSVRQGIQSSSWFEEKVMRSSSGLKGPWGLLELSRRKAGQRTGLETEWES